MVPQRLGLLISHGGSEHCQSLDGHLRHIQSMGGGCRPHVFATTSSGTAAANPRMPHRIQPQAKDCQHCSQAQMLVQVEPSLRQSGWRK